MKKLLVQLWRTVFPHLPLALRKSYRKWVWSRRYENATFPLEFVGFETLGNCNRSCDYCPVSVLPKRRGKLPNTLVFDLFDQLAKIEYRKEIGFHFLNEPLVDKRIFSFLTYARQKLRDANIKLFTNGDLLDADVLTKLVRECKVSLVSVSLHDREIEEKINVVLTEIDDDIRQHVGTEAFYDPTKVKISHRGGSLLEKTDTYNFEYVNEEGCDKTQFHIDHNGDVHPCGDDGLGEYILGNVKENSLLEIYAQGRNQIKNHFIGNFTNPACLKCIGKG